MYLSVSVFLCPWQNLGLFASSFLIFVVLAYFVMPVLILPLKGLMDLRNPRLAAPEVLLETLGLKKGLLLSQSLGSLL